MAQTLNENIQNILMNHQKIKHDLYGTFAEEGDFLDDQSN